MSILVHVEWPLPVKWDFRSKRHISYFVPTINTNHNISTMSTWGNKWPQVTIPSQFNKNPSFWLVFVNNYNNLSYKSAWADVDGFRSSRHNYTMLESYKCYLRTLCINHLSGLRKQYGSDTSRFIGSFGRWNRQKITHVAP
jgi:hypothetical protein